MIFLKSVFHSWDTTVCDVLDDSFVYFTGVSISVIWLRSTEVQIIWTGVFSSSTRLVYEVSIGKIEGGSDILQWVETLDTHLVVSPLHKSTDYYVTVTAINAVGLHEIVKYTIIG